MARNYSQIITSIWLDADFRALTSDAQWTYLMLISQSDITSVGSLPMTLKRWSSYASGMSIKRLSNGIAELESHRFIVVDHTVEELLVRSFVRWDGGYKIPKRLDSIKATALRLNSPALQQVAAYELTLLGIDHGIPGMPIERVSEGYPVDIDSAGVVVTSVGTTPNPQPATVNPVPGGTRTASDKGTRMSDDWQPSARLIEFVKTECPAVNGRTETDNFRDYWIAKPGAAGRKTDWDRTYTMWMRKAQGDRETSPTRRAASTGSTTDDRVNAVLAYRSGNSQPRLEIA